MDRASTCLYYGINGPPPVKDPILVLNGDDTNDNQPINNLCFPSVVSNSYAPPGKSLCSVTVVGDPTASDAELDANVRAQMAVWFDGRDSAAADSEEEREESIPTPPVREWTLLRTYRIPHSQPSQMPLTGKPFDKDPSLGDQVSPQQTVDLAMLLLPRC